MIVICKLWSYGMVKVKSLEVKIIKKTACVYDFINVTENDKQLKLHLIHVPLVVS